jgi:hypothetical protein
VQVPEEQPQRSLGAIDGACTSLIAIWCELHAWLCEVPRDRVGLELAYLLSGTGEANESLELRSVHLDRERALSVRLHLGDDSGKRSSKGHGSSL